MLYGRGDLRLKTEEKIEVAFQADCGVWSMFKWEAQRGKRGCMANERKSMEMPVCKFLDNVYTAYE